MDFKDPNFFRLNYLCLNNLGTTSNQSVIIEQNIKKSDKAQTKSNKTSISKIPSTPKYNKINNSKSLLKDKNSSRRKTNWSKARLNNRKVLNNIYKYYINDNSNPIGIPISLSPASTAYRDNKQRNYRINLYNEIISKTNTADYRRNNRINSGNNTSGDNISTGNIINNTFMPLTETKCNYLNNNNTYFHTNFVFKIDSNPNINNKLYKGSSYKLTPNKKKNKNIKNLFEINNNSIFNNYFTQNDNSSNYHTHHNLNNISDKKTCMGGETLSSNKNKENKTKNRSKNGYYKISYKLCNNTVFLDSQPIKGDSSKINKDKNDLKLILNSLKKDNYSKSKIKLKKINIRKNQEKNKNDEKKLNNKSYLSSEKSDYKCRKTLNNINNSKLFETNVDEKMEEDDNASSYLFSDQNLKNKNKKIKLSKTNFKESRLIKDRDLKNNLFNSTTINNEKDSKLEEYKSTNDELKNDNNILKSKLSKYENNINSYKKDINKLKNDILKLTNENDTLKIVLKNSINIKLPDKASKENLNSPLIKSSNKYININQMKKDFEEKNHKLYQNIDELKKQVEIYEKEISDKNAIISEKEDIIKNLSKNDEKNKSKINMLEKDLEEIKKENDNLYKYKSLYDDKEIELIQFKNNISKYKNENNRYQSLKLEYDELLNNYNKIKEFKDKYFSVMKECEKLKYIEKNYNDLSIKYNNIKEESEDLDELREIKKKYNELLKEYNKLNDIKVKYDKMKIEFEELKDYREKYGKILKEQKNLLLIENKYNDLIEEVKELREIKEEYEKRIENKESNENISFKMHNISFGENGNI